MLLRLNLKTQCWVITIYIGAKLEYEMLSSISCFIDLKYAFIALVMLLFQPLKTMSPPVQFVIHIIVQRIPMKKHCTHVQNMSYIIFRLYVYI